MIIVLFLFCFFPVFAQKCKLIHEQNSRTHARYITVLGHTTIPGTLYPDYGQDADNKIAKHKQNSQEKKGLTVKCTNYGCLDS